MIKQDCIPLESPTEWKDALMGVKHSFGDTWENCCAMQLTTGFKTYLYCFEGENARIVCPIAEWQNDNYLDFHTKKNALVTYCFSKEAFSYLLSLDSIIMVGGHNGGKVVAASVVVYVAHEGEYLFNVSLPEGRDHSASLIWYGVNRLKSLGIPLLNLGGGWASLAEFKRRFGANKLALKTLKQVHRPEIYQKLCWQAKIDPNDMTAYFPAYRSR